MQILLVLFKGLCQRFSAFLSLVVFTDDAIKGEKCRHLSSCKFCLFCYRILCSIRTVLPNDFLPFLSMAVFTADVIKDKEMSTLELM